MMAESWAESTWEITNYGGFINHFPPNIIRSIRQFERINKKTCRQKMSIMFNQIYIYYICVCVSAPVCVLCLYWARFISKYIKLYKCVCVSIFVYVCVRVYSESVIWVLILDEAVCDFLNQSFLLLLKVNCRIDWIL